MKTAQELKEYTLNRKLQKKYSYELTLNSALETIEFEIFKSARCGYSECDIYIYDNINYPKEIILNILKDAGYIINHPFKNGCSYFISW